MQYSYSSAHRAPWGLCCVFAQYPNTGYFSSEQLIPSRPPCLTWSQYLLFMNERISALLCNAGSTVIRLSLLTWNMHGFAFPLTSASGFWWHVMTLVDQKPRKYGSNFPAWECYSDGLDVSWWICGYVLVYQIYHVIRKEVQSILCCRKCTFSESYIFSFYILRGATIKLDRTNQIYC